MDTGSACGRPAARRAIHSPSRQACSERLTTDAVRGGTSAALASGSAFSRSEPSAPRISYL